MVFLSVGIQGWPHPESSFREAKSIELAKVSLFNRSRFMALCVAGGVKR